MSTEAAEIHAEILDCLSRELASEDPKVVYFRSKGDSITLTRQVETLLEDNPDIEKVRVERRAPTREMGRFVFLAAYPRGWHKRRGSAVL